MKRYIQKIQLLLTVLALGTLASCSSEEELTGNTTTTLAAGQIEVGSFPAFSENTGSRASSIGTPYAGKTAWANGDKILLTAEVYPGFESNACIGTAESTTTYTLTYDGTAGTWAADKTITLSATSYQNGVKFTALYAPNYEWNTSNALVLKTGKAAGTDEYLTTTSEYAYSALGTTTPSISFSAASRNYSRLRVATVPGLTLKITSDAFTVNGETSTATDGITATADAKGNAYFYGSWAADASLKVEAVDNGKAYTMTTKTLVASEATKSYAMDMRPTGYNQWGAGTEEAPYLIANAAQLADIAAVNNNGSLKDNFTQIADIDLSSVCSESSNKSWTPIGRDLYQFKGTYDGGNHSISNIYCKSDITSVGLFGEIYGATIKNVRLTSGSVLGTSDCGGIVGSCVGNILNCSNAATINGTRYCGGIAGLVPNNDISVIAGCSNSGSVKSSGDDTRIGGIVGSFAKPTSIIVGCSNTGKISSTNASTSSGGVAGYILNNNIQGCFTTGTVSQAANNTAIGTVVGTCENSDSFTAKGSVSNVYYVANEGIESIGNNKNSVSCTDVTAKTPAEMNETATVNSLNASIKAWNADNPDKLCKYHFEVGTGTATPLPVIVEEAPQ